MSSLANLWVGIFLYMCKIQYNTVHQLNIILYVWQYILKVGILPKKMAIGFCENTKHHKSQEEIVVCYAT